MNNCLCVESIPVVRLSSAEMPLEHRLEVLAKTVSPLCDVFPLERHSSERNPSVSYAITSYLVDSLIFSQASLSEIQVSSPSQHLSVCGPDCVALCYVQSGSIQEATARGELLTETSDVITIQDFVSPFDAVVQSNSLFSVIIPRHAVNTHDQLCKASSVSVSVNSPMGRVLIQTWLTLWETLPKTSQADATAIAQGFLGLLNGLLSGLVPVPEETAAQAQATSATEDAMKAYLQDNLHLPDINVNALCQVFHCSRATVYRLFKAEGGVSAYVRKQRLTRCYQDLRQLPPSSRKTIGEIASKWGFTDAASFSRLFRKQYGIAPSDVGAYCSTPAKLGPTKQVDYWGESDRLRQWLENYRAI